LKIINKMDNYSGKLIVIDGTDGSGKTTQFHLLKEKLEKQGYQVEVADFPQYNTKSAGLVEEYLSGKYGSADDVDPYKASVFYAVDRYDASFQMKKWLEEGKIILSNRYVSASMGHQACKIDNSLERKLFLNWLYDLEYKVFEIPKPNLSIILHVAPEISQKLAKDRAREDWDGKTNDIHEENLDHLKSAEQSYLDIAQNFPDFTLIECVRNNDIMSREEIHEKVWEKAKELLGEKEEEKKDANPSGFNAIGDIINNNHKKDFPVEENNIQEEIEALISKNNLEDSNNEPEDTVQPQLLAEKLDEKAKLPQKAHTNDAGFDLYASDYYSIPPYGQALVSTGIKMAIPDNHVGLIWDKSGLANEGITTMGGVIESDYRGEIKVIVKNLSEEMYNIIPKQKIAQILIQPISDIKLKEEKINDNTERQANGFGSSGKF